MKRTVVALLLALALGAGAQRPVNLGLIPTPQRVEVDGEWSSVKGDVLNVKEKRVDTLPVEANLDQAYQLVVGRRKVTVLSRPAASAARHHALLHHPRLAGI